jgi:DNA-directed RNA polymerase subunit RPC12/RpoP
MCAVVVTVFFGALLFSYPTAAPIWIAGVIFSVFCFCLGMGSSRMNKEALKYQYRKDMYRDSYQVLIECEFCSHLNPPDTLDCQHCDGPLSNSQTVQGEIPDWLKPETVRIQNRYKCTHCDAVYGYDSIKEDGSVICQNCRRSFLPESDELG